MIVTKRQKLSKLHEALDGTPIKRRIRLKLGEREQTIYIVDEEAALLAK